MRWHKRVAATHVLFLFLTTSNGESQRIYFFDPHHLLCNENQMLPHLPLTPFQHFFIHDASNWMDPSKNLPWGVDMFSLFVNPPISSQLHHEWSRSCTQVNCGQKVNCRIRFRLAHPTSVSSRLAQFYDKVHFHYTIHFQMQFTFRYYLLVDIWFCSIARIHSVVILWYINAYEIIMMM